MATQFKDRTRRELKNRWDSLLKDRRPGKATGHENTSPRGLPLVASGVWGYGKRTMRKEANTTL
jgi:hypothetical protein